MDLPPLNVNKFQASVDIIRYCEWPKIKKYMNKRIIKAVNECKTQATIAKKFVGQIEKKKWSLKKRSSSKGELEEKYDLDDDEAVSWGSDFDDEEDDDDLDDVENSNVNFIVQENCFVQQRAMNDCRKGHYDLSQLNNRYENEEQLLNVGRFERINSPTKNLMNGEIESNHFSSSIITLAKNNLDSNASSMCSSNVPSSASSSGTSSICGGLVGSNDPSTSSNIYSSSSNSSAVESTKSQSPPPLSTSSSKLACKLLAKLLSTSGGQLEQNNQNFTFSSPNLQSKTQFNEQLKYALSKKLNELNEQNLKNKLDEDFLKIDRSSSMLKTNHNNNYLKYIENNNEIVNKSMVDLSNNKKEFFITCLNEETNLVKTKTTSSQPKMKIFKNKFNLNNSKTNLTTLKSNLTKNLGLKKPDKNNSCFTKSDNDSKNSISQKNCILERNQKQNEFFELDQASLKNSNDTSNNLVQLFISQDNNDEGLSSGRSSILSSFKFKNSDKSSLLTDSSGSCSSSIKSISLKQLSIKPTVPPKPNITFKEETNRKRKNVKVIRPTNGPPPPPLPVISSNKSPYSSFNSLNEDLISEFTIEEVNEILNCKISDDDNDFLNDVDFTRKLLQQQFSQAKSLQHLTDLEKEEQVKTIENGLKLQSKNEKSQSFKKISQNLINENDCITEKKDDKKINTFNTKLESKFENEFDESLNKILINQKLSLKNKKEIDRKKINKKEVDLVKNDFSKKDESMNDYEKPIKEFKINYLENLNNENSFIENTISPPPEFDDQYNLNDKIEKLNEEFKNQVKKHAIFNKNILNNNKWSCVEINSDKNLISSNNLLKSNNTESFHQSIKNISVNPSFNLNEEINKKKGYLSSSVSNIPVDLNRPNLPRNKLDAINLNKTDSKKLPNKLKSLPEVFTAKINSINYQAINKLNEETKLIKKNNQSNQLSIHLRPLPELPLEHYDWFHDLEREEAANLLIKFSKEGGFLVRKSKRAGSSNPYSLTIYNNNKIFNLNIRKRDDNLFALGKEKDKEKTFQTIPQLIEYHKNEAILLTTKGQNAGMTKLITTPNKI